MSVEDDIRSISASWDQALTANDADAVASFMTDDWVYVAPNGVTPKADIISWIRSGRLRHHAMRTTGRERLAIHGSTAVLTARKTSSGTWDGQTYAADEWISEVYVRDGEQWLCMLSQKSPAE